MTASASRCRSTSRPSPASTMLAAEIKKREPKLDILVNNAGAAWGADFDEFPESGWDKVMNLNVKSPFFLTKALRGAAARGGERRAAGQGDQHRLDRRHLRQPAWRPIPTPRARPALIHLTRRMAAKLIRDQIVVTAIAPGPFASDMNRAARDNADEVATRVPSGRIGTRRGHGGRRDLSRLARRRLRGRRHHRGRRRHRLRESGIKGSGWDL